MSRVFWEPEVALELRLRLLMDRQQDGSLDLSAVRAIGSEAYSEGAADQLAQSVIAIASETGATVPLDAQVGYYLGWIPADAFDIPSVAGNIKFMFDSIAGAAPTSALTIGDEQGAQALALACAIATASIVDVSAAQTGANPIEFAATLQAKFGGGAAAVKKESSRVLYEREDFTPGYGFFDVESGVRLNFEYEDHNIEAMRNKSISDYERGAEASIEIAKSVATLCWAINRTIDLHRDDSFVFDFNRIGTDHIGRIARAWGIKEIDVLTEAVEEIMKGMASIYESGEREIVYPYPAPEHDDRMKYTYIFNIALAAVISAHVFLLSANFDMTNDAVYGEARRILKEVRESRVAS